MIRSMENNEKKGNIEWKNDNPQGKQIIQDPPKLIEGSQAQLSNDRSTINLPMKSCGSRIGV